MIARIPWSDVDIAKLIELWRAGVSTRAIFVKIVRLREEGIDLPGRRAA